MSAGKIVLLVVSWLLLAGPGLAAGNKPAPILEIFSADGNYVAVVKLDNPGAEKKKVPEEHTLYVYRVRGKSWQPLWSTNFEFAGYYGGVMSNNGNAFCYIDFRNNQDTHVVLLNRRTHEIFTTKSPPYKIRSKKLIELVSHLKKVHEGGMPSFSSKKEKPLAVELVTLDGKKYRVDRESGVVLN